METKRRLDKVIKSLDSVILEVFQGLTMICLLIICNGCKQKHCLNELSLAASIKSLCEHGLDSYDSLSDLTQSEIQMKLL